MIAHIKLDFETEAEAKRILSAISPDNSPLPLGLEIDCETHKKSLTITIRLERSIDSLGATLEDIMSAIDLSMRTSESLEM